MKFRSSSLVFFLVLSFSSIAQNCPPPEAELFFARAMKEINPNHAGWVKNTASDIGSGKTSADNLSQATAGYGRQFNLGNMDIEALMMFVMMQVSKEAENEFREQLEQMKKANEQKKKLREAITKLKQQRKEQREMLRAEYDSLKRLGGPMTVRANNNMVVANPKKVTQQEIDDLKESLMDRLDSMNEVSEMTSLRLQMIMDRRSKMISTLTNLMKKIGQAQDNIVQNLK